MQKPERDAKHSSLFRPQDAVAVFVPVRIANTACKASGFVAKTSIFAREWVEMLLKRGKIWYTEMIDNDRMGARKCRAQKI